HTVGEILNQAFGLFRYVSDSQTLECFKMQYVYSCLSEAIYTCVSEQDGKIIGVIMGHAKTDYHILRHLPYVANMARYSLKMKYLSRKSKAGIKDYKNLHKIYHNFSQKHKGEFDGVLTLFAVDESCRGFGVGKNLLAGLLDYLHEQNVKRIYLYTDTTCSYGFYEHMGFERLEEQILNLTREGNPFQMKVFLYGYSL
ncbi:MAG TPA: GNAT family N-acetyltransferase, partial [Mobilitalea sp.]|nr:GNAT family N-acetyltransferase [Mobilitalea sp.]